MCNGNSTANVVKVTAVTICKVNDYDDAQEASAVLA